MVIHLIGFTFLCSLAWNLGSATERPTIGIITEELVGSLKSKFPFYDAYIAASYVKAVESAGARPVPIIIGQSKDYYKKIFNSINGILIPGGALFFNGTDNYYSTGKLLYEMALKANQQINFPILGVCLGFELLVHVANHEKEIRKPCMMRDVNLSLQFAPKFKKSSLFHRTLSRIIRTLETTNSTVNYHKWCVYPEDFESAGLGANWKILSTSLDQSQNPFISTIEHKKFPIAGVQFHPEKTMFEWSVKKNYPHTPSSIEASRHFYDWLVAQARLNNNSFDTAQDESLSLIYNYSPVFSDLNNISYTQTYLFKTQWLRGNDAPLQGEIKHDAGDVSR